MRRRAGFVALIAAMMAGAASAQPAPDVVIRVEKVAPGVAVLFGNGGNIGVSYGSDGTVLIDDQFAPLTPKIEAAVASLSAGPVKYVLNTHWHFDHTGGNENFGKAGAVIMAHDNVRIRMAAGGTVAGRTVPASPSVALPVVTWHDGVSLHLNGDTLRTHHMHDGHTDGDSIVHWTTANVVHMGDLFVNKVTLPFIDIGSGGSARGLLAAIDKTLGMIDDRTVVIPGHGPVATKADLTAYRTMIASVIDVVAKGIARKQTLVQIQALKPAAAYEVKGAFITGDAFVAAIHRSLTAPKATRAKGHSH